MEAGKIPYADGMQDRGKGFRGKGWIRPADACVRRRVRQGAVFGTGWGLTEEVFRQADAALLPISGCRDYNHLSVRSAVSIYLDRLFGARD